MAKEEVIKLKKVSKFYRMGEGNLVRAVDGVDKEIPVGKRILLKAKVLL